MVPAMTSAGARVDLTWCTTTQPQIIFGVRFTRNAPCLHAVEQACREDQKLKIINQQSHENHFLI